MIIMNSSDRMVTCSSGCHSMKIRFIFLRDINSVLRKK